MKVKITFTLDEDLAKDLDRCADSLDMNRSQFLEWLLAKSLPIVPSMASLLENIFTSGLKAQKKAKVKGK